MPRFMRALLWLILLIVLAIIGLGVYGYFTTPLPLGLGAVIKTPGGTNVTPAELEAVLATYPDVLEAYVVGVPADGTNEWVAAAVVPRAGESLSDDDVRTRLKGDVSAYKVPRYVWICAKSDLPFADSGKIQRAELAARLATRFGDS